jgi:ABC-2 type transport system ATP-binding protein
LCDRLAVVVGGRIVAAGTPASLVEQVAPGVRVRFATDAPDLAFLSGVPGVDRVDRAGSQVTVEGRGPLLARVAHALVQRGLEPADLRVERPSLEDAYLALTGDAQ